MIYLNYCLNAKSFLFGFNLNLFFSLRKISNKCFPLALTKGPVDVIGTVQVSRALAPNQNWNAIARYFCVTLQGISPCVFVLLYVTVNYV